MKNFFFHYRKRLLYIVPLIINALFIWFLSIRVGNNSLAVHDSPLLITATEALHKNLNTWNDQNFGYTQYLYNTLNVIPVLLSKLLITIGVPVKIMQLSFYFVMINAIFYSAWYSFHTILVLLRINSRLIASYIGAFFYTYNLYMIASWHGGTVDTLFLTYALVPFGLSICLEMLEKGITFHKALVLTLCIGLTINTGPFAAAVYIAFSLPMLGIVVLKKYSHTIWYFIPTGIVALLMSGYFITSIYYSLTQSDPYPVSTGLSAFAFSDHGIRGLFRFFFEWTINQAWGGRYFHSYYPFFASTITIFSAFALWILSLGTFVINKDAKRQHIFFILIASIMIGLFISKATQQPFAQINESFYKYIPFFGIFRTPDTKFGLPILTSFSVLLACSFALHKRAWIKILIACVVAIQTCMFFTTVPIIEVSTKQVFQRIFKTPQEYYDIARILDNSPHEGRALFVPGISYGNYDFLNGTGITGQDMLGRLIRRPLIYGDGFIFGKSLTVYNTLSKNFDPAALGDASIRYVLLRPHINQLEINKQLALIHRKGILKPVYTSKLGILYEVPEQYYKTFFTIKDGGNEQIPQYNQINSTHYTIRIDSSKLKNRTIDLIWRSSYHPDWKLTIKDKKGKVINHTLYKDFANTWEIQLHSPANSTDILELDLFFAPQHMFTLLARIGSITLILALGGLVYLKKRYTK